MAADINVVMQTANALVTLGCGVTLLYLVSQGKLERHPFYYGWSIGFLLYGTQIFLRLFSTSIYVQILMFFAFIIFFPYSLWVLRPQKSIIFLLPLILLFGVSFAGVSYYFGTEINNLSWIIAAIFFYLPVAIIITVHRKFFGSCVDKLIIGWFSLFLVNFLFPMGGWVADTLAIFGKIILLAGIMSYDFAILTLKVRSGLATSISSPLAGYAESGQLELVILKPGEEPPLRTISRWIKHRVNENIKQKIDTSLLILQDIVPFSILRSIAWVKPEMVHVFMFSHNIPVNPEFTTLKYGITEIGATITEIAKRKSRPERRQEIILVDLSILIHTFGANEVYNLLLNKMGTLRSNGTSLVAPFHTQTHEDSVVALFKTISGRITVL